MISPEELDLLADLARILRKHGPEAFTRLAADLSDPEFVAEMEKVLAGIVRASSVAKNHQTSSAGSPIRGTVLRRRLERLADSDARKGALLLRLLEDMNRKSVLPTAHDVKLFAADIGLPAIRATARRDAMKELFDGLEDVPTDILERRLQQLGDAGHSQARGLNAWSEIIFDKNRRARRAE
jgi:hypothetical protein